MALLRSFRIASVCVIAYLVSACALTATVIDDVAFKDIGPVDRSKFIYEPLARYQVEKYPDTLQLRFTSTKDLSSQDYSTDGFYAWITLCPFDKERYVSVARVLHEGRDLYDFRVVPPVINAAEGKYVYEAFFRYAGLSQFNPETHRSDRFPLPDNPVDLCFRLDGPRIPFALKSNVSTVPAAKLIDALHLVEQR